MPQENHRFWDGRTVHITQDASPRDRRKVEVGLTPNTASELALTLRQAQGIDNPIQLTAGLVELLSALDYVLVGDPASVAAHRRMNDFKGMDPAAGDATSYATPGVPVPAWVEIRRREEQERQGRG